MKLFTFVLAALLAGLGWGCATTASTNVKTSGFYAQFNLRGDSVNAATAEAIFQVGGPTGTFIDLVGGDQVSCNGITLDRLELLGMISYTRPMLYQPGATYEFVLTRPGETPKSATVTLPEAIVITAPTGAVQVASGHNLPVTWTPGATASDRVTIALDKNGDGHDYSESQSPDTGAETIPASFTQTQHAPLAAKLRLTRERAGAEPDGLQGYVHASQAFEVPVTVTVTP